MASKDPLAPPEEFVFRHKNSTGLRASSFPHYY
jgi:hypothetical protein